MIRARLRDLDGGLRRLRMCGLVALTEDGSVSLRGQRDGGGTAGFGGLMTCGSVWACPVCSAKIAAQRVSELERLLEWNSNRGGSCALLTLTLRHYRGQALKTVWDSLSKAWGAMTTGRLGTQWRKLRELLGIDHYVRATEITHGVNGWHVHVHVLLLFDDEVSDMSAANLADVIYGLWCKGLDRYGLSASRRHGVDVRRAHGAGQTRAALAGYMNKVTFETAGGRFKQGREGSRTPFENLSDGLSTGLADDLELWLEWERGSYGRRQLVWSRGLKRLAGVDEVTDEDAAAAQEGAETLLVIPRASWRQIYPVAVELLEATEDGGLAGAMAWLEERRLIYEVGHEPV